jgi:hypothetical protein
VKRGLLIVVLAFLGEVGFLPLFLATVSSPVAQLATVATLVVTRGTAGGLALVAAILSMALVPTVLAGSAPPTVTRGGAITLHAGSPLLLSEQQLAARIAGLTSCIIIVAVILLAHRQAPSEFLD